MSAQLLMAHWLNKHLDLIFRFSAAVIQAFSFRVFSLLACGVSDGSSVLQCCPCLTAVCSWRSFAARVARTCCKVIDHVFIVQRWVISQCCPRLTKKAGFVTPQRQKTHLVHSGSCGFCFCLFFLIVTWLLTVILRSWLQFCLCHFCTSSSKALFAGD